MSEMPKELQKIRDEMEKLDVNPGTAFDSCFEAMKATHVSKEYHNEIKLGIHEINGERTSILFKEIERLQRAMANTHTPNTEVEKLVEALKYAEGQLIHAGYTKNAAPVIREALKAYDQFRKKAK